MRKGQRLVNYITKEHIVKNKDVHTALYYMEDEEFDKILKAEGKKHKGGKNGKRNIWKKRTTRNKR